MGLTVCQKIGIAVATWSIAGALAVMDTLNGSATPAVRSWILIALAVAVTVSVNLMLWRFEADLHRDISGEEHSDADVLRIVN